MIENNTDTSISAPDQTDRGSSAGGWCLWVLFALLIGFFIGGVGGFFAYLLVGPEPPTIGTMYWGLAGWMYAFFIGVVGSVLALIGAAIGRRISKPYGFGALIGGLVTVAIAFLFYL